METNIMSIILQLIPSIVTLVCAYWAYKLINQWLFNEQQAKALSFNQQKGQQTLSLRLQALERLSLYAQRIAIPNLIARLRTSNMSSEDLQVAMFIATQQEFEHNITQQLYVSDHLWDIIKLAKDETLHSIQVAGSQVEPTSDANNLIQSLSIQMQNHVNLIDQVFAAIKKEGELLV